MEEKIIRCGVLGGLLLVWAGLTYHYFVTLCAWAELRCWRTQPLMYAAIESWMLFCILVSTYLAIKLANEVTSREVK